MTAKPKKVPGEKFVDKYGVSTANIYKGDPDALQIPPKGHPLYDETSPTVFDELRVCAIDLHGEMTDPIEVWSDPDSCILWVLDGRGRLLDVREVNRRRKEKGLELVEPYIVPFPKKFTEMMAVARVREKNYHRRLPTHSGMASDILALRNAGHPWDAIAGILHVETDDAEQWCKKRLPLAFAIPEVRAAFDAKEIPLSAAHRFGGRAVDGSAALGKAEQRALLAEYREPRAAPLVKARSIKTRGKIYAALTNGVAEKLGEKGKVAAGIIAFIDGDDDALREWPEIDEVVRGAIEGKE